VPRVGLRENIQMAGGSRLNTADSDELHVRNEDELTGCRLTPSASRAKNANPLKTEAGHQARRMPRLFGPALVSLNLNV